MLRPHEKIYQSSKIKHKYDNVRPPKKLNTRLPGARGNLDLILQKNNVWASNI